MKNKRPIGIAPVVELLAKRPAFFGLSRAWFPQTQRFELLIDCEALPFATSRIGLGHGDRAGVRLQINRRDRPAKKGAVCMPQTPRTGALNAPFREGLQLQLFEIVRRGLTGQVDLVTRLKVCQTQPFRRDVGALPNLDRKLLLFRFFIQAFDFPAQAQNPVFHIQFQKGRVLEREVSELQIAHVFYFVIVVLQEFTPGVVLPPQRLQNFKKADGVA